MVVVPRRVPWTTPEEFHQVFSWLFAGDGDLAAQRYAINRIKVWMSRGNCPHAIESTASLLELILRDTENVGPSQRPSQHELRLGYSMAIIRFVNSLVDPLQTTYFARSMASLASQLGLPLWFVELRHAATHEDLPGLAVLRDAARQALDWLYSNYWLPTLAPTSQTSATIPILSLDTIRPILSAYKSLMKLALRDASKASQIRPELTQTFRAIEAWVVEAESLGRGRDRAIEGLVEALVESGALVPAAKKKRVSPRAPELSAELVSIWSPLLNRLDDTFEGFQDALLMRIVEQLGGSSSTETNQVHPNIPTQAGSIDRSYPLTLSAWVVHLLRTSEDPSLTETTVKSLLVNPNPTTLTLVDHLATADDQLAHVVKPLVNVIRNSDSGLVRAVETDEVEGMLGEMERRMKELEERLQTGAHRSVVPPSTTSNGVSLSSMSKGWPLVTHWKPCPIGSLPSRKSGLLSLDLPPLA